MHNTAPYITTPEILFYIYISVLVWRFGRIIHNSGCKITMSVVELKEHPASKVKWVLGKLTSSHLTLK